MFTCVFKLLITIMITAEIINFLYEVLYYCIDFSLTACSQNCCSTPEELSPSRLAVG